MSAGPILAFDADSDYRFLSNFHPSPITVGGDVFTSAVLEAVGVALPVTVEHAFQAAKATTYADALHVLASEKPGRAKKAGREIPCRPDWEDVKREVMLACLRKKFAPGSELADRLLATGYRMLVEGNTWGDKTWGAIWVKREAPAALLSVGPVWARRGGGLPDPGDVQEELRGLNWLGRLLMLVRAELDCLGAL